MEDVTTIEQSLTNLDTNDIIGSLIAWLIIPSIIIMFVVTIFLVINSIRRWRLEQAIFEIRDLLRNMQNQQPLSPPQSTPLPESAVQPSQINDNE